ncbi:hypothetical protein [Chitinophaga sp. 212800010-3]|uniref:hypothetical protein n=1 Tax=unclassified Chitinophaga TaxID=2619133 RepID=UPI002DF54C54|nr:hypothetical protein [Chitinophaga sp. 212800010-3]
MEENTPLFTEEFLRDTAIRRRAIIPTGMYALMAIILVYFGISVIQAGIRLFEAAIMYRILAVDILGTLVLSSLQVLAVIFIWLEKDRAIQFALIAVGLKLLSILVLFISHNFFGGYFHYSIYEVLSWMIELMFAVRLFKIRTDWELRPKSR